MFIVSKRVETSTKFAWKASTAMRTAQRDRQKERETERERTNAGQCVNRSIHTMSVASHTRQLEDRPPLCCPATLTSLSSYACIHQQGSDVGGKCICRRQTDTPNLVQHCKCPCYAQTMVWINATTETYHKTPVSKYTFKRNKHQIGG